MIGQGAPGIAQAAEIDDPSNTSRFGRHGEIARRHFVSLVEVTSSGHAMDEVEGNLDVLHSGWEGVRAQAISDDQLDLAKPPTSLQSRGVPRQATDAKVSVEQAWHESSADIAGCPGDEDDTMRSRCGWHVEDADATGGRVNTLWGTRARKRNPLRI
jgi:hypothetical protein